MPTEVIEHFLDGLNLLAHPVTLKESEEQTLENFEVRPTSISDTLSYLALTARGSYKRLHTDVLPFIGKNLIEFVQRITGIRPVTFSGTGLNDATSGGTFNGTVYALYEVTIDTTGTPDTFKWRLNGGAYTTGVAITGAAQTLSQGVQITFAATTGHTLNDTWSIIAAATGQKYLMTGGYNSSTGKLEIRSLHDGGTVTSQVSATTTTDSGTLSFMLFGQHLFYTNGVLAWRKWNGVTDAASGFTTVTKFGIKHKNRAFYFNDVTNGRPDYLWVSDVGLPETVSASNFFSVGDSSDNGTSLSDQVERILLIKERSTWAFYLAPEVANSTLLRADEYKGSVASLGNIWASGVTWVYTPDSGIQIVEGLQYQPSVPQLMNFLKGFQNSLAALGFREDQLLIATYSSSAQTRNNRVFVYDIGAKKLFQLNLSLSCFCSNRGITTFDKRFKACEDDGTNRYLVELEAISSQAETNISLVWKSKSFDFKALENRKHIDSLTLDILAPNTANAVTLKTYADDTLVNTQTWTPSATGYQRHIFTFLYHIAQGNVFAWQLEYTQPGTSASKFALMRMVVDYQVEPRSE